MTQLSTQYPEAVRPQLIVPHNGRELTFLYPAYGPSAYDVVGSIIGGNNLKRPTMEETASFLHTASDLGGMHSEKIIEPIRDYTWSEKYSGKEWFLNVLYKSFSKEIVDTEIRRVREGSWLWVYSRSRFQLNPTKGVFVYDEEERERFDPHSNGELEKMLSSKERFGVTYSDDEALRFAPPGYRTGEMTHSQLVDNTYLIALTRSREGAEKLAEFAAKYADNSCLFSFDFGTLESVLRRTGHFLTIGSSVGFRSNSFHVNIEPGHHSGGRAFGLLR